MPRAKAPEAAEKLCLQLGEFILLFTTAREKAWVLGNKRKTTESRRESRCDEALLCSDMTWDALLWTRYYSSTRSKQRHSSTWFNDLGMLQGYIQTGDSTRDASYFRTIHRIVDPQNMHITNPAVTRLSYVNTSYHLNPPISSLLLHASPPGTNRNER